MKFYEIKLTYMNLYKIGKKIVLDHNLVVLNNIVKTVSITFNSNIYLAVAIYFLHQSLQK